jgi:UDP-glucose 4-epimerase
MGKVLVTGGAGFIASHLVDALIGQGHDVVVIDDLSRGIATNINKKAKFYNIDIRSSNLNEVFLKERPEIVNHHAARTSVTHSLSDPIDDANVNIIGSLNLLQNCLKWRVKKIIYASSGGAVYGEPIYLPCDESHPINPLSPYGVSKYAVELYIKSYLNNYGLNYIILRYANVYGPHQILTGETSVIAKFCYQMTRGLDVSILGNGKQQRDFIHVKDIVRANILAMKQSENQVYNLGTGKSISINHLFHLLKSITNYSRAPNYVPAIKGEIFKTFLTADKAKRELGWTPEIDLEEGLKITINCHKDSNIFEAYQT